MNLHVKAAAVALFAGGIALTSAWAVGQSLQRSAHRESHAQPADEHWFETTARPTAAALTSGKTLFLHNCAHCHGIDARGDEGPDLHDVQVSDRYISTTILRGVPHEMPAFGKKLSATDVTALVAFVRSLENDPEPAPDGMK
jgi:mono/diheme cytochrome c family protein